ncbi:MAG: PQQ-dependent sugar dehydrogenase, partial [Acidimicrobiia bacterium]
MHRLWVMVAVVLVLAACSPDTDTTTTTTTTEAASATTTTSPSSTTTTSVAGDADTTTSTAVTTTTLAELRGLAWEEVADLGGFITGIEPVVDGILVARKDGRLTLVADDGTAEVVADLGPFVLDQGEAGLLDTALHPDGDRLFVHYSDRAGDTVLAELPWPIEGGSQPTVLYAVAQPAGNHNGGSIEFGPDGRLHLALGDGGGANDQFGQGQRRDTPLAAIHRFDVDTPGVASAPPDNPFPDGEVPSLWVYGVRNPWRIAFDGDLAVIADVG